MEVRGPPCCGFSLSTLFETRPPFCLPLHSHWPVSFHNSPASEHRSRPGNTAPHYCVHLRVVLQGQTHICAGFYSPSLLPSHRQIPFKDVICLRDFRSVSPGARLSGLSLSPTPNVIRSVATRVSLGIPTFKMGYFDPTGVLVPLLEPDEVK